MKLHNCKVSLNNLIKSVLKQIVDLNGGQDHNHISSV